MVFSDEKTAEAERACYDWVGANAGGARGDRGVADGEVYGTRSSDQGLLDDDLDRLAPREAAEAWLWEFSV